MIKSTKLFATLNEKHKTIVLALNSHATILLDHTPRFKYFTLHGSQHIENLFSISDILIDGGLRLTEDEAFFLSSAICLHDVGMVVPLRDVLEKDILSGIEQLQDPMSIEKKVRDLHNEFIEQYIDRHFDFATSMGITIPDLTIIQTISKAHRKVNLSLLSNGIEKSIGALLRVIDELDITPSRAPLPVLLDQHAEMDSISLWHWVKHNICRDWRKNDNISFNLGVLPQIKFILSVNPPTRETIPYWLNQVKRPLHRVLFSENCAHIITERWGIKFYLEDSLDYSNPGTTNTLWQEIAERAFTAGRKVILVVDDEMRKLEDLFIPLTHNYQVVYSPNARDAIDKLNTGKIDLAIIDLQVGTNGLWLASETDDFKMTGFVLADYIHAHFPNVKIGILTGSRYDLGDKKFASHISFFHRKPISTDKLESEVNHVLA